MAFRQKTLLAARDNENVGIIKSGVFAKTNLLSRNRSKPLANLNNIIHKKVEKNAITNDDCTTAKNKNTPIQLKSESKEATKEFHDDFFDVCSFKRNDQDPEEKWLSDELANINIFHNIIEADKPRTKPITKQELDWIEYFEFKDTGAKLSEEIGQIFKSEPINEFDDLDKPEWPYFNMEKMVPPAPDGLFDDLDLSESYLHVPEIPSIDHIMSSPVIQTSFDDMNFLNNSLEKN